MAPFAMMVAVAALLLRFAVAVVVVSAAGVPTGVGLAICDS